MDFKKKVPLHNGKLYYENKFVDSLFSITQPKSHDYTRVCVCDVGIYCCHRTDSIYFEIVNTSTFEHGEND